METLTTRDVHKQKVVAEKPVEEEMEDDEKKHSGSGGKRASNNGGLGSSMRCCQVENCTADLSDAKQYHKRHKVCERHAKAPAVVVARIEQRFCQQCSRFHELSEFDEAKRSCRRRLAGHNERRRKNSGDEGSNRRGSGAGGKNQLNECVWSRG